MYARVTTVVFAEYEPAIAEELFTAIVPAVQPLDGFKGITFLAGLEANTLIVQTFWESDGAMRAAWPVLEALKQAETAHRGVVSKSTASFRVAGSSLPGLSSG